MSLLGTGPLPTSVHDRVFEISHSNPFTMQLPHQFSSVFRTCVLHDHGLKTEGIPIELGFPSEFLQRIVNGGGRLEREYGLGRKRTDLLVLWPYSGGVQRVVIELKIGSGASAALVDDGLEQTAGYMDRCGAREGHLVIFDRNPARTWEEKIFQRAATHAGKAIHVWGM